MASPGEPSKQTSQDDVQGLYSSDRSGLELALPQEAKDARPAAVHHVSSPAYQSPLRHHHRQDSKTRRPVKETLNARSEYSTSEDDGTAEHRINQYRIREEIGRGSFGAVHLAVDQFGQEYAVKEFSKSRLRKRVQSNLLRRPNAVRKQGHFTSSVGFNSPLHRRESSRASIENNALDLIREEIAIMKKLYHPNVVSLIEVLDDPEEDSLYMVMEYCKNGVVMKVGLEQRADPYDEEQCRHWFRDMILGIEYLHAQGIIHRDIKPDNCLVTEDEVLKIVDFGVSEMFEKDSEMTTAKSAGSPAFMPPELCVAKHGQVSGRAADIWSMGVTLYCLRFGRIPFEQAGMLELYESIKNDPVQLDDCDDDFRDLILRLLDKDPHTRIALDEVREHPWVTRKGSDPLLSKEENVTNLIEPPTEAELNAAITGNMGRLLVVMKAVKKFKTLLIRRRPDLMEGIFGRASRIVQPPMQIGTTPHPRAQSEETDMRRPVEAALTTEGVHRDIPVAEDLTRVPKDIDTIATMDETPSGLGHPSDNKWAENLRTGSTSSTGGQPEPHLIHRETGKGQAHNPLEDTLFLDIGTGESNEPFVPGEFHVVSESPGAVDMDIYEKAYQEEIEKIVAKQRSPTLYLTRHVEDIKALRENVNITDHSRDAISAISGGLAGLVQKARRVNLEAVPNQKDATEKKPA